MRATFVVVVAMVAGVVLGPLGCDAPERRDGRPIVAVSVLPLAYFVEELAGESVDIAVLLPPGASPASFEPSMQQVRDLEAASLYVGLGHPGFPFEATWLSKLVGDRGDLPMATVLDPDQDGPHAWLDPITAIRITDHVAAALAEALPEEAAVVESRRVDLVARIRSLDAELAKILAPVSGRSFLVFHPAWQSFADRYGLVQIAIEDDHKEPDPFSLGRVIENARVAGVEVIFVQPQFSDVSAQAIADAIDARVEALDPLARDWDANMRRTAKKIAAAAR